MGGTTVRRVAVACCKKMPESRSEDGGAGMNHKKNILRVEEIIPLRRIFFMESASKCADGYFLFF